MLDDECVALRSQDDTTTTADPCAAQMFDATVETTADEVILTYTDEFNNVWEVSWLRGGP